jgi:hypothetical protein
MEGAVRTGRGRRWLVPTVVIAVLLIWVVFVVGGCGSGSSGIGPLLKP